MANNLSAMLGQALNLHRQGRLEEAETLYRAILEAAPTHADAWQLLGFLLQQSRRPEAALEAFQKAAEFGNDPDVLFNLGNLLSRFQRFDEALQAYDALLRQNPQMAEGHSNRGLALRHLGRSEEALEAYERALAIRPDYPDALFNRGNACKDLMRWPEAADSYRRFLELCPDDEAGLEAMGDTLKEQSLWPETAEIFSKLATLYPDKPEYHHKQGVALEQVGRRDKALLAYQATLALQPEAPETLNNMGVLYKRQGDDEEAERCFRRALEFMPDNANAGYNLGVLCNKRGAHQEAYEYLSKVVEAHPDHPRAAYSLGILLYSQGEHEAGGKVFAEWLQRAPLNPIARHLAAASGHLETPPRAPDEYIREEFDDFASSFDEKLKILQYRAPELVAAAVGEHLGGIRGQVLDAGCGTGLCGPLLKPGAATLIGVDLSGGMLERARARGIYDALHEAELTQWLDSHPEAYDLIISADTLVYFGDVSEFLRAAHKALRSGGGLSFTVEQNPDVDSFCITPSGRYAHGADYLRRVVAAGGLRLLALESVELRLERNSPVAGWLVVARKPDE